MTQNYVSLPLISISISGTFRHDHLRLWKNRRGKWRRRKRRGIGKIGKKKTIPEKFGVDWGLCTDLQAWVGQRIAFNQV